MTYDEVYKLYETLRTRYNNLLDLDVTAPEYIITDDPVFQNQLSEIKLSLEVGTSLTDTQLSKFKNILGDEYNSIEYNPEYYLAKLFKIRNNTRFNIVFLKQY